MKIARFLALFLLCFGGAFALATAEPANSSASSDYEPGTAPSSATETQKKETASEDRARAKEQQEHAQQQNDWLLRTYEEQLQTHALANGESPNNNLYANLTSNQELAKAAGLSPTAPAPAAQNLRTGQEAGTPNLSLRADMSTAPANSTPAPRANSLEFKSPLDFGDPAGLHDLLTSLPGTSSDNTAAPSTSSGALDTPGMVAAESNPDKKADLDLTFATTPDKVSAGERTHQNLTLDLTTSRNSDQIQKQQASVMLAPGQKRLLPPAPISPLLIKPVDDTSAMVPDPSPIRGQVDDPYDILR